MRPDDTRQLEAIASWSRGAGREHPEGLQGCGPHNQGRKDWRYVWAEAIARGEIDVLRRERKTATGR